MRKCDYKKTMASIDEFIEYKIYEYLFMIGLPFLITFGTIGNILSLFVLLKPKHRRCSVARSLIALAFTDLCLLWISGLINLPRVMFRVNIGDSSNLACKCITFVAHVCAQMSVLLIVAITFDRFIAIFYPLKTKSVCSKKNTTIWIILTITLSVLLNCRTFLGFGLNEKGRCVRIEEVFNTNIVKLWTYLHIILLFAVPVVFVTIANAMIGVQLALRIRNPIIQPANIKSSQEQKNTRTTKVLTLVSVVYLVCITPTLAFYLKYGGKQLDHGTSHHDALVFLFWGLSSTAYLTNSAINFVLYFLFGSKFRKEVKQLFCCEQSN